ncbi:MAG: sugar ABC transporter substrate-binding protein [Eubacteriales bacterium]|nr:sugar ABC transporter substrate-binding protein [Eubacteriales bacterium]
MKKRYKKIASVVLCTAMLATGLSGMEVMAKETDGEEVTLEVWSHHSAPQADLLASLGERYSEATGQKVKVNYTEVAWDDYIGTKLTTAFASGDGPDIFTTCPPQIARYVSAGIAMPLNDYLPQDVLDDFNPSFIQGVTFGDDICAIPTQGELLALYYDADLFEKEGIAPPKTWAEMIEAAKALTTDTRAGMTMRVADDSSVVFDWLPFLWMTGADVMDVENKKSLLDSQGAADSLQIYHDLMEAGALNVKPSRNADEIGILCEGETAMQISGTWAIQQIEDNYPDSNIGVLPIPVQKEGDTSASAAGGWQMVVNSQSENADIAAKMLAWAFAEDMEIPTEWCTEVSFCYPARKSILEAASDVYEKGLRKVYTEEIFGTEKPELRAPADVYKILQDMIQQSMYESDGKTAAMEAHEKLQEFLDEYEDVI